MYSDIDHLLEGVSRNGLIPAMSLSIGRNDRIEYAREFGYINELKRPVTSQDRFDIASLTKIISGLCFMMLVERKSISLDTPVCEMFPELVRTAPIVREGKTVGYTDASKVTWKNILTHTSGIGRRTTLGSRPSMPNLSKGLDDILYAPFLFSPGEHIMYSNAPIILMGTAMERMTGMKLDTIVSEFVLKSLNLKETGYIRISGVTGTEQYTVPTEYDSVFRKKRIWGCVHDENAYLLDGVSAHAGIFSTSHDLCILAMHLNRCLRHDGIIRMKTAVEMTREQVVDGDEKRGLIWCLDGHGYWHNGFTGCFLWNDPVRDYSVVFLSNDIYQGRDNRIFSSYRNQIINMLPE